MRGRQGGGESFLAGSSEHVVVKMDEDLEEDDLSERHSTTIGEWQFGADGLIVSLIPY